MIALPEEFSSRILSMGPIPGNRLLDALSEGCPSVSVRTNVLRGVYPLAGGDVVDWLPDSGRYLAGRPVFAADPLWHQGLYYVQEASSMIGTAAVRHVVEKYFGGRSVRYLDSCAAPGGKTIGAIEALPEGSVVLANEADAHRAGALIENLGKQGFDSLAISVGDARRLGSLGPVFDIAAVDAPCSGEGMMRKEEEARRQWSSELVDSCARLQREILDGVWQTLRPGGVLIYSTCTFNRQENDDNIRYLIEKYGAESIALPLDYEGVWNGGADDIYTYRFMPGYVRGEGIFISAVRKGEDAVREPKLAVRTSPLSPAAKDFVKKHVIGSQELVQLSAGMPVVSLVPSSEAGFFGHVASKLKCRRCGLPIGSEKGRDIIPAWELAFSRRLDVDSFPRLDLGRDAAMAYLHGDSLTEVPEGLPKGIVLVTYSGYPLGFIKNIGRRANNLYPDALRLRLDPTKLPTEDAPKDIL